MTFEHSHLINEFEVFASSKGSQFKFSPMSNCVGLTLHGRGRDGSQVHIAVHGTLLTPMATLQNEPLTQAYRRSNLKKMREIRAQFAEQLKGQGEGKVSYRKLRAPCAQHLAGLVLHAINHFDVSGPISVRQIFGTSPSNENITAMGETLALLKKSRHEFINKQ